MTARDPDARPTAGELAACAAEVRPLHCAELASWLAAGRACSIVDVRTEGEFRSHRLPGARLVPLHALVERIDEVLALPGPLVVHCEHGVRSLDATAYLVWRGRGDVHNVVEGIAAWRGVLERG
ncbi:MAG: rhodanese-like domain-containing protein [Deltaproteobacteria bacterium]|nr:rhodanese-like domain-containing protein [Deltaproteobacteria bacterium]